MPQGLQALLALLVLLPGFASARIVRMMSSSSQQTELERVIEALIFSFLTYVVYIVVFGTNLPVEWIAVQDNAELQHYSVSIHRSKVISVVGIAAALGFCWGYVKDHDLLSKQLRKWKLTERTSRDSVWNDVFLSLGGTVQVGLADGRTVMGWLARYSDRGGERSLFLERAAWVSDDGKLIEILGSGLLLTEKSEILFVMFLDQPPK